VRAASSYGHATRTGHHLLVNPPGPHRATFPQPTCDNNGGIDLSTSHSANYPQYLAGGVSSLSSSTKPTSTKPSSTSTSTATAAPLPAFSPSYDYIVVGSLPALPTTSTLANRAPTARARRLAHRHCDIDRHTSSTLAKSRTGRGTRARSQARRRARRPTSAPASAWPSACS
jgi:hypothetical protein